MKTFGISTLSFVMDVMQTLQKKYSETYPDVQVVFDPASIAYIVYPTFNDYKNDTNRIQAYID